MRYPTRFWSRVLLFGVLIVLQPACAVVRSTATPVDHNLAEQPLQQPSTDDTYWWYVQVKINWPEEQPMAWYMDVLLAHQVFKSILTAYAYDIELWRFHRRAARDQAGHRFSFIFYARQATATAILDELAKHDLLAELLAAQQIERINLHDANQSPKHAIEATSDKNWSLPMQRAWPYFAMGVSQVWLSLIDQYVASTDRNGDNHNLEQRDLDALIEFYKTIDEKVATAWEIEGGHALLHHLNALFGYGEVAIYERRMIRF